MEILKFDALKKSKKNETKPKVTAGVTVEPPKTGKTSAVVCLTGGCCC